MNDDTAVERMPRIQERMKNLSERPELSQAGAAIKSVGLRFHRILLLMTLSIGASSLCACSHGHSGALWRIVHEQCVPNQLQHGSPAPCAAVELSRGDASGSAVLKDRHGPYQYLLIPTAPISGIEAAALYESTPSHYFADAWAARRFVEQGVGHPLPRQALSLAINSRYARSQNQLHIHVDCLTPSARDTLAQYLSTITDDWAPLPVPLAGHIVNVRRIHDPDLAQSDPFQLMPAWERASESERARHTLVLAGAHFADNDDGFILIDGRASLWPLDRGYGEDLQDHACR